MEYLSALRQRYSVKKFDATKIVPPATLASILEAGKLSASSLGLQPYRIFVVESKPMKEKLATVFYNPSQINTCSHLLVIVSKKNLDDAYLEGYFKHISDVREVAADSLTPFRNSVEFYRGQLTPETIVSWNEKQAYIVLANLMFAAALENVDTCPMEGFKPEINAALGLDTDKEHVAVTLALGYRAEDDLFQTFKKVRKPDEKLFTFL